eukprot:SM007396S21909  [mRNA]  locus=s7396:41:737:- [translate_table: standard]
MGRAAAPAGDGLRAYYAAKAEQLAIALRDKTQNLRRLEAQRNDLNSKGGPPPLLLAPPRGPADGGHLPSPPPRAPAVRMLREELQLLQEPGSYVGEVVKVMGKTKVLVKGPLFKHCLLGSSLHKCGPALAAHQVHPEGKYVVDVAKNIDITKVTPTTRVALRNDSYVLHLMLPSK